MDLRFTIKFNISPLNDVYAFFELIKQSKNHKQFLYAFTDFKEPQNTKKEILNFIVKKYKEDNKIITRNTAIIEKEWFRKEKFFISEVKEFFNNEYVFNKKIIASPSLWPMYGRFLSNNLITFPYNKSTQDATFVIAHELLHLILYDYLYTINKFSSQKISIQKIWNFSEALNSVIQNDEKWIKTFGLRAIPCPEHQALYDKLTKLWKKGKSVDDLIRTVLIDTKTAD